MKFGPVAIADAAGAVLAHALQLPAGRRLKKGSRLSDADAAAIGAAGIAQIIVARIEAGDCHEDEAAGRIAAALASPGIEAEAAATGRVNLYAKSAGLFTAGRSAVDRINAADPGITLATLEHLKEVNAGRMVATVKIIPYAVPEKAVSEACRIAKGGGVIELYPYAPRRIGVVATTLPTLKASAMDKTIRVLQSRLVSSGSVIVGEKRVAHEQKAVAAAIGELLAQSDIVVIFGASAISDIDDEIPAAIRLAGGKIVHFGMPVDPGNLMLLAEAGGKPIVGAPGCARSPAGNGFDWILQRLIAGRKVTAGEITAMGVGGLLMEIGTRPQPREAAASSKHIGAIVLAAGHSRRMGTANKLLATFDGKALLRHAAESATASAAVETIVVTGHESARTGAAVLGLDVLVVYNPEHATGIGSSVRAGISALGTQCDGAIVLLGDMPGVSADMIDRMIAAAAASPEGSIIVATHNGKRGNPVLWPRRHFEALKLLSGDTGARGLIGEHGGDVVTVELGEAAGFDLDTPQELETAGGKLPAS